LGFAVIASELSARLAEFFNVSLLVDLPPSEEGYVIGWSQRRGLFLILLWMLMYLFLLYLVGYYFSTGLAIVAFVRFYGRNTWVKALIASVATIGLVYVGLGVLMGLHMFRGVLFGEIL